MNDVQTKKLDHYRDLLGVFTTYETTIAKYASVKAKIDLFRESVGKIQQIAKVTSGRTTVGITAGKSDTKSRMATLASELASGALSYAHDQGDLQLKVVFDLSVSDILYARHEESLNLTRILLEELENVLPNLADYLIDQSDLDALKELADEFEVLSEQQGGVQADSKQAHKQLKLLFSDAQKILVDQLDNLIHTLNRKESQFASTYFGLRDKGFRASRTTGTPVEAPAPAPQS